MEFLPKVLEDIIGDYKNQMEQAEKKKKVLEELKTCMTHYKINKKHYYCYPCSYEFAFIEEGILICPGCMC